MQLVYQLTFQITVRCSEILAMGWHKNCNYLIVIMQLQ